MNNTLQPIIILVPLKFNYSYLHALTARTVNGNKRNTKKGTEAELQKQSEFINMNEVLCTSMILSTYDDNRHLKHDC